jgi:hypothetical protein
VLPCAKPAKATRFDREAERRGSQLSHVCLMAADKSYLPLAGQDCCPTTAHTCKGGRTWCANAHVDASQPCYPTSPHNRPSSPLAPAPLLISGCRCCCWSSRSCLSSTCRPCAAISVAQQSKAWDKNIGSSPTRGGTQLIDMALEWQKSGYRCVRISSSLCPLPAARLLASCASLPCVGRRRSESTHIRFPSVRARDEAIQAEANWPR